MVTLKPRESSNRASDDEMMPLPNDDTTPPVTKMYRVSTVRLFNFLQFKLQSYK
jgi:hypothetical protein